MAKVKNDWVLMRKWNKLRTYSNRNKKARYRYKEVYNDGVIAYADKKLNPRLIFDAKGRRMSKKEFSGR